MPSFNKPALTITQQVELLRSRGLIIPDTSKAEHYLRHISYYRLSAYALPFQVDANHTFGIGITFDQILNLYIFDRSLRVHLFDAIERIEVSLRAAIILQMAISHGSHWHEDPKHFKLIEVYEKLRDQIAGTCHPDTKQKEVFIKHYLKTYDNPPMPPCWMCFETLTMGSLSKIYTALQDMEDRRVIARQFLLPENVFGSWLHAITYIRNICAHHSRLWNRELSIAPISLSQPVQYRGDWISQPYPQRARMYYALCCITYLMQRINPKGTFTQRTKDLMNEFRGVPLTSMGFQAGWEEQPLWKH